jgi:hypothetical protein
VPTFSESSHSQPLAKRDSAAIVEARDIPILSSTDRLQRALLKWVDICGLSGQFVSETDVVETLSGHECLDHQSYLLEIDGKDPDRWSVLWTGYDVNFEPQHDFRGALLNCIPDDRFANLIVQEYVDAVRYRRASARRFAHRNQNHIDTMDQLIFPLRDAGRLEFVLVVGETVTGRSLYERGEQSTGQHGDMQ